MLTPRFDLDQDEEFLLLRIYVPYVKATEADFFVEDNLFQCHIKPYFLRLYLPGNIVEDGRETASYDINSGELFVRMPKQNKGEHFADLDLQTKLLATQRQLKKAAAAPIEVINSQPAGEDVHGEEEEEEDSDLDWELPQQPATHRQADLGTVPYGFNKQFTNFISQLENELHDVILLQYPEKLSQEERSLKRIAMEDEKFDQEHYMSDFVDDENIQSLISFKNKWQHHHKQLRQRQSSSTVSPNKISALAPDNSGSDSLIARLQQSGITSGSGTFTFSMTLPPIPSSSPTKTTRDSTSLSDAAVGKFSFANQLLVVEGQEKPDTSSVTANEHLKEPPPDLKESAAPDKASTPLKFRSVLASGYKLDENEKAMLRNLPKREYIIDDAQPLYLGLVDLVFAFLYDARTTEDEHNSESGWTINRISAMLSCLEVHRSLRETVVTCFRRAMAYPLYRHWKLCVRVLRDTVQVFELGRRAILSCLLGIKRIFDHDEQRHYLCRLYIDDYCVWIQQASDKTVASLAQQLANLHITKADIGWPLLALEEATRES